MLERIIRFLTDRVHFESNSVLYRLSFRCDRFSINLAEQVGETEHEIPLLVLSPGDLIFRGTLRSVLVY